MFESKFMLSSVIASINARLLGTAERLLQEEARAAQELREQRELEGGAMLVYGTRHLDARNEADCLSQDDPYYNHGKPAPLDLAGLLRNYANMRHMLVSKLESVATSHYDKPQSLGSTMAFMIGQAPDGTFRDAREWAAEQVERDAKDGRYAQVAALLNDGGEEVITAAQLIEAAKLDRQKQIETTRHNAGKIIARANEAMLDARNETGSRINYLEQVVTVDEDFTDLVTNLPSEVRDALLAKLVASLAKAKARAASVALKRMDIAMEEIASLRLDTEYVVQLRRASGEAYRAEQQAGVALAKAKEEPAAPQLTPAQKAAATRKANKAQKERDALLASEASANRQANKAARLAVK